MDQVNQDILNQVIQQAERELADLEKELKGIDQLLADYPTKFAGCSVLDYQIWDQGRKQLLTDQEEKQREIRYKKVSIESLLSQKQLTIF